MQGLKIAEQSFNLLYAHIRVNLTRYYFEGLAFGIVHALLCFPFIIVDSHIKRAYPTNQILLHGWNVPTIIWSWVCLLLLD